MDTLELVISLIVLFGGFLTLALRNTPNPYIGVRMGYTYYSKEAWKRANTFAGIYCIVMGFVLLMLSILLTLPRIVFFIVLIILSLVLVLQSYRIAKETYEKEDLSLPVKDTRPLETVNVKPYLFAQLVPVAIYFVLVAVFWSSLPERVAIHFDFSGKPDIYADKIIGIIVLPFVSMMIMPLIFVLASREPMIIRFPIKNIGQTIFILLVAIQIFIVAAMSLALLYNAGVVFSELILWFVIGFVMIIFAWTAWIWKTHGQKS